MSRIIISFSQNNAEIYAKTLRHVLKIISLKPQIQLRYNML